MSRLETLKTIAKVQISHEYERCQGPVRASNLFHVHKFGGSSLVDPEAFFRVAEIVVREAGRHSGSQTIVVLSARGGLTDQLHELYDAGLKGSDCSIQLRRLRDEQLGFIRQLFFSIHEARATPKGPELRRAVLELDRDLAWVERRLRELAILSDTRKTIYAQIVGLGEIWSARLFSQMLQSLGFPSGWLNARSFLYALPNGGSKDIDFERSQESWKRSLSEVQSPFTIVTGYVSTTSDGLPSTLGRNGSDFSAALVARLASAESLTIWSDVDGILSIDPDLQEPAVHLDVISYCEADELARLGAGVLHSHTVRPLRHTSTHLLLKNSLDQEINGSRICRDSHSQAGVVTGLSEIRILILHAEEDVISNLNLRDSGLSLLTHRAVGNQLFLAFEVQETRTVFSWLRSIRNTGNYDSLRLGQMLTGCLVAWVRHDIASDCAANSLWQSWMKKAGRQLVFETQTEHALIGMLRIRGHAIPTRLIHRKVLEEYRCQVPTNSSISKVS